MKMHTYTLGILMSALGALAADVTVDYGWEDGTGTILSSYGNLSSPANVAAGSDPGTNNETPSHDPWLSVVPRSGSRMLQVSESPHSSTPQAYLATVENLTEGDQVTVSFWGWDSTATADPSQRVWGHYAFNGNVDSYDGSAGGSTVYTAGTANGQWSQVSYTWTVDAGKEALVIECRLYSTPSTSASSSTTYWIDDLSVTAPDTATITTPAPANTAPVLNAIADATLTLGQTLQFTASAVDSDTPAQTLTYSLTNAPAGATIQPSSGTFLWTPDAAPATRQMGVVATDDGTPGLSDTEWFTVTVLPKPVIEGVTLSGTSLRVNWESVTGQSYYVYYKNSLLDAEWLELTGPIDGTGGTLSVTNTVDPAPQRYYTVGVGE